MPHNAPQEISPPPSAVDIPAPIQSCRRARVCPRCFWVRRKRRKKSTSTSISTAVILQLVEIQVTDAARVCARTHTHMCITTAVFLCSPKTRSRFCSLVTGCHFVWTLNEDPESGSSTDVEMSASGSRREALARRAALASQPKAPA